MSSPRYMVGDVVLYTKPLGWQRGVDPVSDQIGVIEEVTRAGKRKRAKYWVRWRPSGSRGRYYFKFLQKIGSIEPERVHHI